MSWSLMPSRLLYFRFFRTLISFNFFSFVANKEDKRNIKLSYNFVDKLSFFKIPKDHQDINKAIEALEKQYEDKWPCSREEEVLYP